MSLWDASNAQSSNSSQSNSYSQTFGTAATQSSNAQAALANNTALAASREAQNYNAEQARIQREWQERMANTVYQRSVADMKKAGINPILAANMGLGTGSVGSGAAASISNPSTFMGNSFADQQSASHAESSGFSNSESGLATFITSMQSLLEGLMGNLNSSMNINIGLSGLKDVMSGETYDEFMTSIDNTRTGNLNQDNYRKTVTSNNKKEVGDNKFLKFLNGLQLKATGLSN